MIKFIKDFVFYHPYTITGLYFFVGIILGVAITKTLISVSKLIAKLSKKRVDKFVKRVVKNYIIVYFTTWGIYNCLYRIMGLGTVGSTLNALYNVINIFVISRFILEIILGLVALRSKVQSESLTSTSIVENVIKIIGYICIAF